MLQPLKLSRLLLRGRSVRVSRFSCESGSVRVVEIEARRRPRSYGGYRRGGATKRSAILALPAGPAVFGRPAQEGALSKKAIWLSILCRQAGQAAGEPRNSNLV